MAYLVRLSDFIYSQHIPEVSVYCPQMEDPEAHPRETAKDEFLDEVPGSDRLPDSEFDNFYTLTCGKDFSEVSYTQGENVSVVDANLPGNGQNAVPMVTHYFPIILADQKAKALIGIDRSAFNKWTGRANNPKRKYPPKAGSSEFLEGRWVPIRYVIAEIAGEFKDLCVDSTPNLWKAMLSHLYDSGLCVPNFCATCILQ